MSDDKQAVIDYLKEFVSENRYARIREVVQKRTRHITLVIENLFQSHNVSAILRTAECSGIQDVHIIENESDYEINNQIAIGAQKWLSVYHYSKHKQNTEYCLKTLKKKGYKIVATLPHENESLLRDVSIESKIAFLFGSEHGGLSQTAIDMADEFVKIPMYGFTESYNVSVAVALTLMDVNERLRRSSVDWQLSDDEIQNLTLDYLQKSIKESDFVLKQFQSN
ncbi:MAG: RNA methyltransferase [Bacteroidales bacterium]|jgi:tRNA (guanosine-2'-O-)-methyltransferase|nr:RNA methyltransferase [Bacteroidales bacterium]